MGRLFREFSVCIGVAVLISGFISLTLTPMLASRFLRAPGQVRHGAGYRVVEGVFDGMVRFYGWTLRGVLKAKFLTMLVLVGVLVGTVYLFMIVPKGFIPSEDQGFVFAQIEAAEGISPQSMAAHQQEMATALQDDPNFEFFLTVTGMSGPGGVSSANKGIMFFRLKPRNQRPLSADQIVSMIYKKASNIAGIKVFPQNPAVIPTSPRSTMGQYQFTLLGSDTTQLFAYAQELEDRLKKQQGFVGVSSDLQIKNPQVSVDINRDLARSLGITAAQIESTLQLAYGSGQISTILAPQNQYQVILEAMPQYQFTTSDLSLLYVRSDTGKMVPLPTVANIKENYGPLSVNHTGQIPSVTLSYNLAPGMSLGESLKIVDDLGAKRPASVTISRQGAAQQFTGSQSDMMMLGAVTILVIYIVLGVLYESFIHPITILSALPFAGFGAVATLVIFNVELSLYAFVGIIMLIGLVKKNGIIMIDFALAVQREGKSPRDAMYQACLVRFRPITMTTLAALMAGLPIALGFGAGAESRRPLGLAVVGGLVFSQTLTLYATPVVYLVMERLRQKLGRRPKTALPAILLEEKTSHPD